MYIYNYHLKIEFSFLKAIIIEKLLTFVRRIFIY